MPHHLENISDKRARIKASDLLIEIFVALNAKLDFLVLRNFDQLPNNWRNDIDILLNKMELATSIIDSVINKNMVLRYSCAVKKFNFYSIKVSCSDRELQIDLYNGLSKAWINYADIDFILKSKIRYQELFDTPNMVDESLLIVAKELFSYGYIRERYHKKMHFDEIDTPKHAKNIFGKDLSLSGLNLLVSATKDPTVRGRPRVKFKSLLSTKDFISWIIYRMNNFKPLTIEQEK